MVKQGIHSDLTGQIIGCAFKVYNQLGFGFLESVYEKCLLIELEKANIRGECQMPITVYYENQIAGIFKPDILVDRKVIVELKSVQQLVPAHEVQLVNYLKATNCEVGLLINFGSQKVEIRKKFKDFTPLAK